MELQCTLRTRRRRRNQHGVENTLNGDYSPSNPASTHTELCFRSSCSLLVMMLATWTAGGDGSLRATAAGVANSSPELLLVPQQSPGGQSPSSIPLKIWAQTRQAALRPTTRDLRLNSLLSLMGYHYEPTWMSHQRPHAPPSDEGSWNRSSVRRLRELADKLPLRESLKEWLVSRASCPVRYAWRDLGEEFWPRWLRNAECLQHDCSWPPGMHCVPAPPRHLHVLKWHCRLRKHSGSTKMTTENNVLTPPTALTMLKESKVTTTGLTTSGQKKKKRKRYRCLWVKVPYPVTEDCQCGCEA